jgi:hypothetical protein
LVVALLLGHAALSLGDTPRSSRAGATVVAPSTELGLEPGMLPPVEFRRLERIDSRDRHPRLVDVWLDPTFAGLM